MLRVCRTWSNPARQVNGGLKKYWPPQCQLDANVDIRAFFSRRHVRWRGAAKRISKQPNLRWLGCGACQPPRPHTLGDFPRPLTHLLRLLEENPKVVGGLLPRWSKRSGNPPE